MACLEGLPLLLLKNIKGLFGTGLRPAASISLLRDIFQMISECLLLSASKYCKETNY